MFEFWSVEPSDFVKFDIGNPPLSSPGVYIFKDASGQVLYVGESQGVTRRYGQHKRDPKKKWTQRIDTVWWYPLESEDDRLRLETYMILRLRPRHNRAVRLSFRADGTAYISTWGANV
jgi:excinuclease ABC subunit C